MSSEKATTLTSKEAGLLAAIMKNSETEPKVDWNQTAIDAGYNNAKTVREMYRSLKKKILLTAVPGSGGVGASTAPVGGVDKYSPTKKSLHKPRAVTGKSKSPAKPKRGRMPAVKKESGGDKEDGKGDTSVGKTKEEGAVEVDHGH